MPKDKEATKSQQANAKRHLESIMLNIDFQNELAGLRRDIGISTATDDQLRQRLKTIMNKYSVDGACTPVLWKYCNYGGELDYSLIQPLETYRGKNMARLHENVYRLHLNGHSSGSIFSIYSENTGQGVLSIENINKIIQRKKKEDPNRYT